MFNDLPLTDIKLNGGFMGGWQDTVAARSIPYQWDTLDGKGFGCPAVRNLRIAAGLENGEHQGFVFSDSDLYKWAEAAALTLAYRPDPSVEARIDALAELLTKAQREDGYLNSYYQIKAAGQEWTNLRDNHEMYCAGHLIEAAVAYREVTGKTNLLEVAKRLADHIDDRFGPEPGKKRGYGGHPEIEIALYKLYKLTGDEKYLNLAKFLIDERGQSPSYYMQEARARGDAKLEDAERNLFYFQAHKPVREQTDITGHSVRALYLAAAMADIARETGDETLRDACEQQLNSATKRRMYITGGVGSQSSGERFTFDYDLPSDTAYTETCAAIALAMFASRLSKTRLDGRYADVMERALLNGSLAGISLDGERYFYANPLWVWPEAARERADLRHIKPQRPDWYSCACCPPNIARTIALLGRYSFTASPDTLAVHLYPAATGSATLSGVETAFVITGGYPWTGDVIITLNPKRFATFTLALRVPGWANERYTARVNGEPFAPQPRDGYLYIRREWRPGDTVELELSMLVRVMHADPRARHLAGLVALERGPFVYCFEQADNGENIPALSLKWTDGFETEFKPDLLGGVTVLSCYATRAENFGDTLYCRLDLATDPPRVIAKAIPYYAWANRGEGEMAVWMRAESR